MLSRIIDSKDYINAYGLEQAPLNVSEQGFIDIHEYKMSLLEELT